MKKLYNKIFELYKKYEEIINYLIFGVLTTITYLATYALFTRLINIHYLISTTIAWIVSVTFAFVTNKIFVFKSKSSSIKEIFIEAIKFYSARLFTLGADLVLKKTFVDFMHINDMIATLVIQVIIIVLNYVLSKLLVFKNSKKNSDNISEEK